MKRTLISIQIMDKNRIKQGINQSWDDVEPTFHEIEEVKGSEIIISAAVAQAIANATGYAVRMTYPTFGMNAPTSVGAYNGHYFQPKPHKKLNIQTHIDTPEQNEFRKQIRVIVDKVWIETQEIPGIEEDQRIIRFMNEWMDEAGHALDVDTMEIILQEEISEL